MRQGEICRRVLRPGLTQHMAKGLNFRIYVVTGGHYLCSENKGADQPYGYIAVTTKLICH